MTWHHNCLNLNKKTTMKTLSYIKTTKTKHVTGIDLALYKLGLKINVQVPVPVKKAV